MARSTVELELVAVVSKAAKTVEDFTKTTQKSLSSITLGTAISGINAGFELVEKTAGRAFSAIAGVISDAVDEAADAEQSITNLTNALRLQNDFSKEAIEDFNDFAGSLQRITIFSDDAVLNSLALAKQFRATNTEAKAVVRVAADLAAITGTDLNTATQKVAQTLNGFVDKSLAKAIPELKGLSKEALISGAAIEVIGARVQGSAEALSNTFNGSVIKARNSFSDLLETLGGFITNNPLIIGGINAIKEAIDALNDDLKTNKDSVISLVNDGFIFLVSSLPLVIKSVSALDSGFSTLIGSFQSFLILVSRLPGTILQAVTTSSSAAGNFKQLADDLKNLATGTGALKRSVLFDSLDKQAEELIKKIKKLNTEQKSLVSSTDKSLSGEGNRGLENTKTAEQIAAEQRKLIEEATRAPIKAIIDLGFTGKIDNQAGIAIGAGLVNGILKGAKGAQDFVASALGGLADTLLPGIGGVVSEIVGVLAQGPDKVRELIRGFVDALPEVISAIVQSVPVLIEELSNAIPVLVQKLVDQLPTIVQALAAAMPQVAISLGLQMPRVAISFVTSLIQNIPNIIAGFAEEFLKIPGQFVDALLDLLPFGLGGGDGGGGIPIIGDIIGGIGDFVGGFFADGGRVPDRPEFRGDKFPARLDAGEQVLSRDLSDKLDSFLNNGGAGGQPIEINLNIGLQQFAKIMLEADRLGYRVRA